MLLDVLQKISFQPKAQRTRLSHPDRYDLGGKLHFIAETIGIIGGRETRRKNRNRRKRTRFKKFKRLEGSKFSWEIWTIHCRRSVGRSISLCLAMSLRYRSHLARQVAGLEGHYKSRFWCAGAGARSFSSESGPRKSSRPRAAPASDKPPVLPAAAQDGAVFRCDFSHHNRFSRFLRHYPHKTRCMRLCR